MSESKLMRIRLFDVAKDGTETEHLDENGNVLIDEDAGLCTGFCLMTLNDQTPETEGEVVIHELSIAELCALMSSDSHTARASKIVSAFHAAQRMREEFKDDASE